MRKNGAIRVLTTITGKQSHGLGTEALGTGCIGPQTGRLAILVGRIDLKWLCILLLYLGTVSNV